MPQGAVAHSGSPLPCPPRGRGGLISQESLGGGRVWQGGGEDGEGSVAKRGGEGRMWGAWPEHRSRLSRGDGRTEQLTGSAVAVPPLPQIRGSRRESIDPRGRRTPAHDPERPASNTPARTKDDEPRSLLETAMDCSGRAARRQQERIELSATGRATAVLVAGPDRFGDLGGGAPSWHCRRQRRKPLGRCARQLGDVVHRPAVLGRRQQEQCQPVETHPYRYSGCRHARGVHFEPAGTPHDCHVIEFGGFLFLARFWLLLTVHA